MKPNTFYIGTHHDGYRNHHLHTWVLLWLILFGTSYSLYAQQSGTLTLTPSTQPEYFQTENGMYDRFGNKYQTEDLVADNVLSLQTSYTCQQGLFTAYFLDEKLQNGYGFNNPTNGAAYRNVLCQVLRDVSDLLHDANPNATGRVRLMVASNLSYPGTLSASSLAAGSSLYWQPKARNGLYRVVDGQVQKTITGGSDANLGIAASQYNINGYGNLYHGVLVINFNNIAWHTDLNTAATSTKYDLYTAILREVLHVLGLASNIDSNGLPRDTTNYFRYDLFLKTNAGQPLLQKTTSGFWVPTGNFNAATSCGVKFDGTYCTNQAVYQPTPWNSALHLSHFGCSGIGSGCAAYSLPANTYVLTSCMGKGANFSKRHPNQQEVNALADIGYYLKQTANTATFGANAQAQYNIFATYSVPSPVYCVLDLLVDDYSSTPMNTNTYVFPLANDTYSVFFPSLTISLIQASAVGGTWSTDGTTVSFTPTPGFIGDASILYTYSGCGNSPYSFTAIINIYVFPLATCEAPDICDLLQNNGFFEWGCGDENIELSNFQVLNPNTSDVWPDHQPPPTNGLGGATWPTTTQGNHYIGLASLLMGTSATRIEGISLDLCNPLVPGKTYNIQFSAASAALSPMVRFLFSDEKPCPLNGTSTVDIGDHTVAPVSINCTGFNYTYRKDQIINVPLQSTVQGNSAYWKKFNASFTATHPDSIVVIHLNSFFGYPGQYILFDSLRIWEAPVVSITKLVTGPLTPCVNQEIEIPYTICIENGVFPQENLIVQVPMPITGNISVVPGGDFNAYGEVVIPAGTLSATNPCITKTLKIIALQTTPAQLTPTAYMQDGGQLCLSSTSAILIAPKANYVSLAKTATTSGANTVFTITITNKGPGVTINLTDILPPLPTGSWSIVNNGGFTVNGTTLTRTLLLLSGTQTNPYTTSVSFTAAVTGNTAAYNLQNCVSATTSLGCSPASACANFTVPYGTCACPAGANTYNLSGNINLSSSGLPAGSMTGGCVSINGTLNLDGNYTFNGTEIRMGASASIVLPNPNITLQFGLNGTQGVYVHGCNAMWQEIRVPARANFIADKARIEDGYNGVLALDSARLTIRNSKFVKNRVGISLYHQPAFSAQLGTLEVALITGNEFHCQNLTLLPHPQVPAGSKSLAGIYTRNFYFNIPDLYNYTSADVNFFHHLRNGIMGETSHLEIHAGSFTNITTNATDPLNPFTAGCGIRSINDYALPFIVRGNAFISSLEFDNCDIGIGSFRNGLVDIQHTQMNEVIGGIFVRRAAGGYAPYTVHFNNINTRFQGITLVNNKASARIVGNVISVYDQLPTPNYHSAGIYSLKNKFTTAFDDNDITLSRGRIGIEIKECIDNVVISNNIHMNDDMDNSMGILFAYSKTCSASKNNITALTLPISTDTTTIGINLLASTDIALSCNYLDYTTHGIQVDDNCADAAIQGNTLYRLKRALIYHANSLTGAQINAGNTWTGPASGTTFVHATHEGPLLFINSSQYRVKDSPASLCPSNYLVQTNYSSGCASDFAGWFNLTDPEDPGFTCSSPGAELAEHGWGDVVTPTDNYLANMTTAPDIPYQARQAFTYRRHLLHKLLFHPQLLTRTNLNNFYNQYLSTKLGKFEQVQVGIEKAADIPSYIADSVATALVAYRYLTDQIARVDSSLQNPALTPTAYNNLVGQRHILLTFYDQLTRNLTTNASLAQLEQQRAELAWLNTLNSINATQVFEQNEKTVQSTYFNLLVSAADTLTTAQQTALLSIANQCPFTGGLAVYGAQALYASYFPWYRFTTNPCDALRLPSPPVQPASVPISPVQLSVQPQPSSGAVSVLGTQAWGSVPVTYTLYNLLGSPVLTQVQPIAADITLQLHHLPSGIYWLHATSPQGHSASTRIVLAH